VCNEGCSSTAMCTVAPFYAKQSSCRVATLAAGRSGLVARASNCGVRPPTFNLTADGLVMFIMMATAIRSLGHELHTFTLVPRSTQPCFPPGSLNRVPALAGMSLLPGGRLHCVISYGM